MLVITALAVRLGTPGPMVFVQQRIGLSGTPFRMLKFRSIFRDVETLRVDLLETSDRAGLCFKHRADPRVTPIGCIIGRYSIDELPQLFNVLMGDMSLVGPRPTLPDEVAAYPAGANERFTTLPGITGVWQKSGRADIGFDQMIEMDIAYVWTTNLWRYLLILPKTVRVVLDGRGAY